MSKLLLTLFVLGIVLTFFAEGRPNGKRWGRGRNVQRKRWEDKIVATRWDGVKPKLARRWMIRFCSNKTVEETNDKVVKDSSDVGILTENEKADDELIRRTRDIRMRRIRKDRRAKKARGRRGRRRGRGKATRKAAKQQWRKARIQKRLQRKQRKVEMLCEFLEEHDCPIPETIHCSSDSVTASEENDIEQIDTNDGENDEMENIDDDEDMDEDSVDENDINDIAEEEEEEEINELAL